MPHNDLAHLRLLQLFSPNAPTGAFSYSQGLEWAVECGWIKNHKDTSDWLKGLLTNSLQTLELPILLRLYQAAEQGHSRDFLYWSEYLYASRESNELRQEEKQRSRALWILLQQLPDCHSWPELDNWKTALTCSQLSSFALTACKWSIKSKPLLLTYSWSWLESSITAAIKLVPLGQSQGQQLLLELSETIVASCHKAATVSDTEISANNSALAIASSLHETQYSRLFRS